MFWAWATNRDPTEILKKTISIIYNKLLIALKKKKKLKERNCELM